MIRTQIQLPDEDYRRLKEGIRKLDVSLSAAVREAVALWLSAAEKQALVERSLASLGRFRSGRRDVSKRHDTHLVELYDPGGES